MPQRHTLPAHRPRKHMYLAVTLLRNRRRLYHICYLQLSSERICPKDALCQLTDFAKMHHASMLLCRRLLSSNAFTFVYCAMCVVYEPCANAYTPKAPLSAHRPRQHMYHAAAMLLCRRLLSKNATLPSIMPCVSACGPILVYLIYFFHIIDTI